MEQKTIGTVLSVKRQWWLKVNTKAVRIGPLDGATFPHVVKIKYTVNGVEYIKSKWIHAGLPCPAVGETVEVIYQIERPAKIKIQLGERL